MPSFAGSKQRRPLVGALLLAPLLFLAWGLTALWAAPAAGSGAAWDPALTTALAAAPGEPVRAILYLRAGADLSGLPEADLARRQAVVERLQATARTSQAPLLADLAQMAAEGSVMAVQSVWLSNAIVVTANETALRALTGRSDIARIVLDAPFAFPDELAAPAAAPISVTWGLSQIGAPQTWAGLGLDGSGTTVAIVDSGVDYLHPDLNPNYRGNLGGGLYDHSTNWYDASAPLTNTVPFDLAGHGTHVAGTAVGQNGIGVAPGARWLAVKIADANNLVFPSYILAGWQWLLAPNGNAALAPDVVNNSWSSFGGDLQFWSGLQALKAAGIVSVFSAGNGGPGPGTIGAPASYTDTLAIGASTDWDDVAWFSSRGPSPLNGDVKPIIIAPGAHVPSAAPGGGYFYLSGTSMAAPHTTGALAVLLGASPALDEAALRDLLANHAAAVADTHPNTDSGWGRLDLYASAAAILNPGRLQLTVRDSLTQQPLAGVAVQLTTPGGIDLPFTTDSAGQINAPLLPGSYAAGAAPFAYIPGSLNNINVGGGTTAATLNLTPLPAGSVQGQLRQTLQGGPIAGVVEVLGTPVRAQADANGAYSLSLPAGAYTLRARATGYGLKEIAITIIAGGSQTRDFNLIAVPRLLLVDQGPAFFQPAAAYYGAALDELGLPFDLVATYDPFLPLPDLATLQAYDQIIWSSPLGSPTFFEASYGVTLFDYLDQGGRLFISGQDVGDFEGVGFATQNWWYYQLAARYQASVAAPYQLSGVGGGDYDGLSFSLNGGDGANNQYRPDSVTTAPGSLTQPLLTYADGRSAALQAGWCEPFHITYFGFGLEGVTDAATRADLLGRALAAATAPPVASGVRFLAGPIDDFALPGETLTYTLSLQNLSETSRVRYQFSVAGNNWPVTVTPTTLPLGACAAGEVTVVVDVPPDTPPTGTESFTLQVTALEQPGSSTSLDFYLHPPQATVLLVDDDRWYDVEGVFGAALDAADVDYETWQIGWNEEVRGSPPADLLAAYDFVVWFTGYDWFAPLLPAEIAALESYVAGGGRLFLTSQDYLYYHGADPFTRNFLGIDAYYEDITPTAVYGPDGDGPLSGRGGRVPLSYGPYLNFSDGLALAPGNQVSLWANSGFPAGSAGAGPGWRVVFWALPFEVLQPTAQPEAMAGVLGWLSELGDSTFQTGPPTLPDGTRPYTLTIRNNGLATNNVTVSNTLPISLTLDEASLSGGAVYNAGSRTITWNGALSAGGSQQITYLAAPQAGLPAGTRLENPVVIRYDRHPIAVNLTAVTYWGAPDLSASRLLLAPGRLAPDVDAITVTMRLTNSGAPAAATTIDFVPPPPLHPVTPTLTSSAGTAIFNNGIMNWQGALGTDQVVIVTMLMTTTLPAQAHTLLLPLYLDDGVTAPFVTYTPLPVQPFWQALPVVLRP